MNTLLFSPITIKNLTIKNRIWISPMCQYSSIEGHPTDWHLVHLGARAMGGAGLVMMEATAVNPEGRISPHDMGIWSDDHIVSFRKINDFIHSQDSKSGIQLAHAGRKASIDTPWNGGRSIMISKGGWQPCAPSPIAFSEEIAIPRALNADDMKQIIKDFEKATERALKANFDVIELHIAHGYLLHEFLSPLSNHRTDEYGGSLENRMRFPLQVVKKVRAIWPEEKPLFVRISATDWAHGIAEKDPGFTPKNTDKSWDLASSIIFCHELKALGVDLIDCSSGGLIPHVQMPIEPGYQVPFSEAIKHQVGILTAAVGLITTAAQAQEILEYQQADAVCIGRVSLRNPNWPIDAAKALDCPLDRPKPYLRA